MTFKAIQNSLELVDGSKIAVIGGGPAGSFFSYFALDYANRVDLDISIDIIEAKNFNCDGPKGCNNCGGIVSESLVQMLATDGIILPSTVIRKGIESYSLHMEGGTTVIEASNLEQRIASMYRGLGPKGCVNTGQQSFDQFLMDTCVEKGATVQIDRVTEMIREEDGIILKTANTEKKYDLVVVSAGLNMKALQRVQAVNPLFQAPRVTKTYISELLLGEETVHEYFGHSMHVFLLNLPHIKFGAMIPKGDYVTLVLLGSDINQDHVAGFLNSEAVRNCFPPDFVFDDKTPCNCFPTINVKAAKMPYGDRLVVIGDSASSKLYKNGIGAAYITGKAAARTVIFDGIAGKNFREYYQPVCTELNRDNAIGKFIFFATGIIQKSNLLKKALLNIVIKEKTKASHERLMSSVLWDTFTGSADYQNILKRFMSPVLLWSLIKNITMVVFGLNINKRK